MDPLIVVSLPITDRQATHDFYSAGLRLPLHEGVDLADDGLPEPLRYTVREGLQLMLIPTTGFSWGLAGRAVADPGSVEAQFTIVVDTKADVDAVARRIAKTHGEVLSEPAKDEGGYATTLADPDHHQWVVVVNPWWGA